MLQFYTKLIHFPQMKGLNLSVQGVAISKKQIHIVHLANMRYFDVLGSSEGCRDYILHSTSRTHQMLFLRLIHHSFFKKECLILKWVSRARLNFLVRIWKILKVPLVILIFELLIMKMNDNDFWTWLVSIPELESDRFRPLHRYYTIH